MIHFYSILEEKLTPEFHSKWRLSGGLPSEQFSSGQLSGEQFSSGQLSGEQLSSDQLSQWPIVLLGNCRMSNCPVSYCLSDQLSTFRVKRDYSEHLSSEHLTSGLLSGNGNWRTKNFSQQHLIHTLQLLYVVLGQPKSCLWVKEKHRM